MKSNGADVDRQESTTSVSALTPNAIITSDRTITTVIPIREEFRCQRAWFFYHDIRALVTSVRASHYVYIHTYVCSEFNIPKS